MTNNVPSPARAGQAAPDDHDNACERPLFDVFAAIAACQPDHLAVDDGTTRLSYAELRDRAAALGARIAAAVPPDGLAGVAVPTTVLYPVAWLACFAARRAFLPLDPNLPPARTQAIIAEAGLAAVIVAKATVEPAAGLPDTLPRIVMAPPADAPVKPPPGLPPGRAPERVGPARVAMVLFTSGSTGRPKGIALHERSQLHKAMSYRAACGLGPHDRLLSLHPPSTNGGAGDTLSALLCGASLHMIELKRHGLARTLALLRDGGITVCATVPVVLRALIAMDGAAEAFRRLRILRLGGDTVTGSDVAALAPMLAPTARILVRFGMTESGATIAQRLLDPRAPVEPGPLALDAAMSGQTLGVVDADGAPVRPGEEGELMIRGRYVALGHWRAGRLDPAGFPADPADPTTRWFRSGDVVLLRPDGMLIPLGRADRQVKINGLRVEPAETEAALRGLPGVADAAVLMHGDPAAPVLVAFVVPAPGDHAAGHAGRHSTLSVARLARGWRRALTALLAPQLVPADFRVVRQIPLLPSMKPDLAALRALLAEQGVVPRALARVWTRLRDAGSRTRSVGTRPPAQRSTPLP
jgi:non-ribosomal peptide synthetase component F